MNTSRIAIAESPRRAKLMQRQVSKDGLIRSRIRQNAGAATGILANAATPKSLLDAGPGAKSAENVWASIGCGIRFRSCLSASDTIGIASHGRRGPRICWAIFFLLAGYLLFCHGCHGDEDHELLVRLSAESQSQTVAARSANPSLQESCRLKPAPASRFQSGDRPAYRTRQS
jgi:hypothetical protein